MLDKRMARLVKRSPTPMRRYIGRKIAEFRIARGLTQAKLGAVADITGAQINRYEKAINKIDAEALFDIAEALAVPVQEFFKPPKPDEAKRMAAKVPNGHQALQFVQLFLRLRNDSARRAVLETMKSLANGNGG